MTHTPHAADRIELGERIAALMPRTIDDLTEAVAELDAKYLAMARAKKA